MPRMPCESLQIWHHEHSSVSKAIRTAALIFGIGMLAAAPVALTLSAPIIGGVAFAGSLLSLAAYAGFTALDFFAPPHHNMKDHAFKPGECPGGKLFYEGDVPILTLDADNPYLAGRAQGFLTGDAIYRLKRRFDFSLHTLLREPRAHQIPEIIDAIKRQIPEEYYREMEGLADGYNEWAKSVKMIGANQLSPEDIILFHLMPDSLHFDTEKNFKKPSPKQRNAACTSIVDRDAERGIVFGRNMDWPSLGIAGTYSLVIHRKKAKTATVEIGIPGLVGTLTGMNESGLSIAMNVCIGNTTEIQGMPAMLYNRYLLEHCTDLPSARRFIENRSPLGAYHLTIADPKEGQSFHFDQGELPFTTRRLEGREPLSVFNCRYENNPYAMGDVHYSRLRKKVLNAFYAQAQIEIPAEAIERGRLVEASLSLPCINNYETTHTVLMEPATRAMKAAFDDAYSGKAPLLPIPTEKLFRI